MYVTIDDLKKHLNVDHSEDDAQIRELEAVAEDAIATYLNKPLSDFCDTTQCEHQQLKPAIRHAIRLLVGTWYASREDTVYASTSTLPTGVVSLLLPLRNFVTEETTTTSE